LRRQVVIHIVKIDFTDAWLSGDFFDRSDEMV